MCRNMSPRADSVPIICFFRFVVVSCAAMEESFATRPLVGRWIALDVRPTRPLTFVGPSWAVICGSLASGALALRGPSLLSLVLAILLCDALLGAWRALWLQSDWRAALKRVSTGSGDWLVTPAESEGPRWLRFLRRASRRILFMRKVIWPIVDSEIIGLLIIGALSLSIGVILGALPAILTGLAMTLSIIEGRVGTARGAGLRSISDIALPWLIAQTALGAFSWLSLIFALLYTLVYRSLLGLATTRQGHWIAWCNLAQVAVAVILIATVVPAGAGIVLLGLLAQVLWQGRYYSDHDGQSYARRVQSYVLVGMLVVGISLWF